MKKKTIGQNSKPNAQDDSVSLKTKKKSIRKILIYRRQKSCEVYRRAKALLRPMS